jgi:hypothetical protein
MLLTASTGGQGYGGEDILRVQYVSVTVCMGTVTGDWQVRNDISHDLRVTLQPLIFSLLC